MYEDLTKQLREKGLELNEHLTNLKEHNDLMLASSDKVLEGLRKLVGSVTTATQTTCMVCYARPPTHVLLPCGHGSLCYNCAERMKTRNRCPRCRGRVEDHIKIFM
jgi:hypothetical protein